MTGPLGFVASRLLPELLSRDVRVLAVVRPGRDASSLAAFANVEVRRGDLARPADLAGAFAGARAVVHLAGMALGEALVPVLVSERVAGGVFVSSAGVHTRLVSAGAEQKRRGEAALRTSALGSTILRPSMIYGTPRDRNLIRLLRWLERFPVVPAPLGGTTPQQPVHVDDLVAAILASLEDVDARREFDVGGPEPVPLHDLIAECALALGRPHVVLPVPLAPAHAAAVFARRLRLPFPVRPEQVLRLTESKAVDVSPARRALGFAPRPFRDGIRAEVGLMRAERGRKAK